MSITRSLLFILFIFQAIVCSPSFADNNYRSKYGFDFKGFKPNIKDEIGWLAGLRGARFLGTSQIHVGLAGYFGTPKGESPADEKLYYGGLTLGADGKWGRIGVFEFGVLVGYGEGQIKNMGVNQKSFYVVEPTASAGFALGLGWRINISAGYIHMNGAPIFSGPTFGIRIDYRSTTTVKDIND